MTRQLTKSRDFRQNYLYGFHLCIRWRGCETEVFLEFRVVQKSTNYFVTLIIYKRNNLEIVPCPCSPPSPCPIQTFSLILGYDLVSKKDTVIENFQEQQPLKKPHTKICTTSYKLHMKTIEKNMRNFENLTNIHKNVSFLYYFI